jgi:WD40 repeat protein
VLRTKDGSEVFAGAHDDFVLALQFSPDGALLAAADRSGTVHLFETATGRIGQTLTGHRGAVNAVAFAGNGKLLATAGADGTVRGFDVATGKETWKQTPHQGEATALAFSPTDLLASAGADGRIAVLARDGKPVQTSNPVGEWLYSLAFGAGDVVFAGDWQGRVHRFDSSKKQLTASAPLAAPTHAQ